MHKQCSLVHLKIKNIDMLSKTWILLTTLIIGFTNGSVHAQQTTRKDQPNIILIFADDLGYKDVGFNGSDYYETPNIDKLAKEGMRFNNAYSSASNCAPSRATMLSGLYNPRHGVYCVANSMKGPINQMRLAPVPNNPELGTSFFTMAEALKSAGYATGIFGKWHIGNKGDSTDPASQGFDVVMESGPAAKDRKIKVTDDPKGIFEKTDAAIQFITANKNKPFFAYVSHNAVHGPHQARKETLEKFKNKTPGKYHVNPLYAACIYDFDAGVGQLLDQLKKLGLDKNTLVIFTSDNGGTKLTPQEPLRGNKGSFYEGGIREPFVARWTGKIAAGSINNTPIINVDFYPTFAALAKVKLPATRLLDGEDITTLFTGKEGTKRKSIYWHFPAYLDRPNNRARDSIFSSRPVSVMRKGDYKIMLYHEEWLLDGGYAKRATNNAIELYNLKTDEGERNNIASANPVKRDELLNDLLAWMKQTHAKMATIKTPEQEKDMKRSEGRTKGSGGEDDD
jgi:arylsulfatase A-like enzyme